MLHITYEPCFRVQACIPDVELALYFLYHIDALLDPSVLVYNKMKDGYLRETAYILGSFQSAGGDVDVRTAEP